MNRMEIAVAHHDKGYNCCQSVMAAFTDRFDIPADAALRLGAAFGGGAGTGELCGVITGALMALDLITVGALNDPVAAKKKAAARSRELQKRFLERFGAVRCRELLRNDKEEPSDTVRALGITGHCSVMIASAVELIEQMLKEEGF